MNARVQTTTTERLIPAIEVLEIRTQVRAFLWWQYQMELHEAVDELQDYAERSGLVREIGQDAVQAIMAAPFARLRAMARDDECDVSQDEIDVDDSDIDDGVADIVRRLELADPRDCWKHTRQPPPGAVDTTPAAKQSYRTPQSTIDAFWFVVRLGDPEYLTRWLAQHPLDAPALYKLYEGKNDA